MPLFKLLEDAANKLYVAELEHKIENLLRPHRCSSDHFERDRIATKIRQLSSAYKEKTGNWYRTKSERSSE